MMRQQAEETLPAVFLPSFFMRWEIACKWREMCAPVQVYLTITESNENCEESDFC